jgi:hypothetical protein
MSISTLVVVFVIVFAMSPGSSPLAIVVVSEEKLLKVDASDALDVVLKIASVSLWVVLTTSITGSTTAP